MKNKTNELDQVFQGQPSCEYIGLFEFPDLEKVVDKLTICIVNELTTLH